MARGGRRQGTPGVAYSNRADLNTARAPQTGLKTAAAGGMAPPTPDPAAVVSGAQPVQVPPPAGISPDSVPALDDPSGRPSEPLTAGIPFGPGEGPPPDPNRADLVAMRRHLPYLENAAKDPNTPQSVLTFVRYLRGLEG